MMIGTRLNVVITTLTMVSVRLMTMVRSTICPAWWVTVTVCGMVVTLLATTIIRVSLEVVAEALLATVILTLVMVSIGVLPILLLITTAMVPLLLVVDPMVVIPLLGKSLVRILLTLILPVTTLVEVCPLLASTVSSVMFSVRSPVSVASVPVCGILCSMTCVTNWLLTDMQDVTLLGRSRLKCARTLLLALLVVLALGCRLRCGLAGLVPLVARNLLPLVVVKDSWFICIMRLPILLEMFPLVLLPTFPMIGRLWLMLN